MEIPLYTFSLHSNHSSVYWKIISIIERFPFHRTLTDLTLEHSQMIF